MPETLTAAPRAETGAVHCFYEFLHKVVALSFDETLLKRQRQLTFYNHQEYAPIQPGVTISLGGLLQENGTVQLTYVGNVEKITNGTTVEVGAQIGDGCYIKSARLGTGAIVEDYSVLEHGTHVSSHARVSEGGKILTQARLEEGAITGQGAEVNYDATMPQNSKVAPFSIQY